MRGYPRRHHLQCHKGSKVLTHTKDNGCFSAFGATVDEEPHKRPAPLARRTYRLAALGAGRSADIINFYLRPTPSDGHYRLSSICGWTIAGDHRQHDNHF